MKLKIVSLIIFMPICLSYAAADQSWWHNMLSSTAGSTAAAYLIPLFVYQQRMRSSGNQIPSCAYLAPLAITLAQTAISSGKQGLQNALMTTLPWHVPAWLLALYLYGYQEPTDRAKREDEEKKELSDLIEMYEDGLSDFLPKFDEIILTGDMSNIPEDLKNDYNNLADIYTTIIDQNKLLPKPDVRIKMSIFLTPAQEIYVRYIAHKIAEGLNLVKNYQDFASFSSYGERYQLRKHIRQNLRNPDFIELLQKQGFGILQKPESVVNKFMSFLADRVDQNDILLEKIFDAIKDYQKILDQKAKDERNNLPQKYQQALANILNKLYIPEADIESLYIDLKNLYQQLQIFGMADHIMPPYDYLYSFIVAHKIKDNVGDKELDPASEQDRSDIIDLIKEFNQDITDIIIQRPTLSKDMVLVMEKRNENPKLMGPVITKIMAFINQLRESDRKKREESFL